MADKALAKKPSVIDTRISEDLTSLLFSMGRLVAKNAKGVPDTSVSSMMGMKTLYMVAKKEVPTMKDIADCFHITPPSATSMVNKLVKAKHLRRVPDKSDRRTIRVEITPQGSKMLKDSIARKSERIGELISVLSSVEKSEFVRILTKIIESNNI